MSRWRSLRGRGTFHNVKLHGRRLEAELVRCWYKIQPFHRSEIQVGFAVRRGAFSAVERSRIKRLMREALRYEYDVLVAAFGNTNLQISLVFMFAAGQEISPKRVGLKDMRKDFGNLCRTISLKVS